MQCRSPREVNRELRGIKQANHTGCETSVDSLEAIRGRRGRNRTASCSTLLMYALVFVLTRDASQHCHRCARVERQSLKIGCSASTRSLGQRRAVEFTPADMLQLMSVIPQEAFVSGCLQQQTEATLKYSQQSCTVHSGEEGCLLEPEAVAVDPTTG